MAAEKTMKHLWDSARALDAKTHTKRMLKSYYINTCRRIAKNNIDMPKEKFAVSQMCPRCSLFWSESEFSLELKPQRVANKGKVKKLLAKLEESEPNKSGILTKKQRRRAKWLKKRVCSSVQIHCEVCKHKSQIQLQKPPENSTIKAKSLDEKAAEAEIAEDATLSAKSKKKKRKRKDTAAGLKITQQQQSLNSSKAIKKDIENTKVAVSLASSSADKSNKYLNKVTSKTSSEVKPKVTTAPAPNIKSTSTIKTKSKQKKKKLQKAATTQQIFTPTKQSNTQKQNSLLQLAALLKKQSSAKSNTAADRLKSLLK